MVMGLGWCSAGQAWGAAVTNARLLSTAERTRVVFALTDAVKFKTFVVPATATKPERLVIDIRNAKALKRFVRQKYRQGLVVRIRSGRRNTNDLRLVVDLVAKSSYKSQLQQTAGIPGYQLVVDLYGAGKTGLVRRGHQQRPRVVSRRQLADKRRRRTRAVKKIKTRDVVIAIDAGHGGDDPGAIGLLGTKEKDVVLRMARNLYRMVKAHPGMRPVMIRHGDYYVDLRTRMRLARKHKADLFISIHANSARKRSARGVSVYTLSSRGATSQAAKWLAERENRSDIIGGTQIRPGVDKGLAKMLLDLSQTSTSKASVDAASVVLRELSKITRVHRRGLERAGFVVLKSPDVPSILIETGFISNPSEEIRLRNRRYQRRVAAMILRGIVHYFVKNAPPDTMFAKRKHVIEKGETLKQIASQYKVSLALLKRVNGLRSGRARVGNVLIIPRMLVYNTRSVQRVRQKRRKRRLRSRATYNAGY